MTLWKLTGWQALRKTSGENYFAISIFQCRVRNMVKFGIWVAFFGFGLFEAFGVKIQNPKFEILASIWTATATKSATKIQNPKCAIADTVIECWVCYPYPSLLLYNSNSWLLTTDYSHCTWIKCSFFVVAYACFLPCLMCEINCSFSGVFIPLSLFR